MSKSKNTKSYNWTLLELKFADIMRKTNVGSGYNWTLLDLKFALLCLFQNS